MTRPIERIQLRLVLLSAIALVVFVLLLGRLWFLQVLAGDKYAELAEGNRIRLILVDAPRGIIYDRNGYVLVGNRPSLTVSLDPFLDGDKRGVIERLSKVLGMTSREIEEKLREKTADPLKPRAIKRDVDMQTIAYLKEHQPDFPGVTIEVESARDYLNGSLAAHVLGYLGELSDEEFEEKEKEGYILGDVIGKTGVEKEYESLLRGEKGGRHVEVDATGRVLRVLSSKDPIPGHNLSLTIDRDIQLATEMALAEAIQSAHKQKYSQAAAGAAVVMDATNGEILALTSYPTYDPRIFIGGISKEQWSALNDKASHYPLINRAMMCSYAPGSTFKPITGIAGLAEGLISPRSTFDCRGRWTGMGERWAKYCWKRSGHGRIDFNLGVVESCDVVFYEIGYKFYRTGQEGLQKWARKFGLGLPTGVDLPSEARGRVPDKDWKKKWNKNNPRNQIWLPGDTVNLAIGQGDLLVTPLQMASVFATIANEGTLYRPRVAKSLSAGSGKVEHEFDSQVMDRLELSPGILRTLKRDLERVVTQGTAKGAFAGFPIPVAGKTGTAEVRGKDDFAWFACYAPANDPKYVILVMVEQGGHGGSTAAPAARQILSHIYGVPFEVPSGLIDPSR